MINGEEKSYIEKFKKFPGAKEYPQAHAVG
jgi:hypothetical protein